MGPGAAVSQGTMGHWLWAAESHHGLCGFWRGAGTGAGAVGTLSRAPGNWGSVEKWGGSPPLLLHTQLLRLGEGGGSRGPGSSAIPAPGTCSICSVLCPTPALGDADSPTMSEGTGAARFGNLRAPSREQSPRSYPGLPGRQALCPRASLSPSSRPARGWAGNSQASCPGTPDRGVGRFKRTSQAGRHGQPGRGSCF